MKHLIVYSHPNPKSFNHAIKETFAEALKKKKHDVHIRDLYTLNFDPVLKASDFELLQKGRVTADVGAEQNEIKWADTITFIFPIWWTGLPARLKGYIDRVFSHGFAFVIDQNGVKGLLTGKKVLILNTTGTPQGMYEQSGMQKSMNQTMDTGIFEFCGMQVVAHKYFSGVTTNSPEERNAMLGEVEAIAQKIN